MEAAIEKEKKQIRKQFEKEKSKIQQMAEINDNEKQKLLDELAKKEES